MKKVKTKKGVAKRFKLTKKGKIKYHACSRGHLLTTKKSKRLRNLRKARTLTGKQATFIKDQLPYGRG